MLQVQHLALQFVGHHVNEDDLAGHALGEDAKGAGHADLADANDGDLVARAADGLSDGHHEIILQRHIVGLWSVEGNRHFKIGSG